MTSTFETVCKIAFSIGFLWKKEKSEGKKNRIDESSIFFKLFLSTEVGGKVHIEYQCCYQIVMLEYHYAHSESKKIKNFKKIVVVVFFFQLLQ